MSRAKQKHLKKAVPVAGVVGVSMALAGGSSAIGAVGPTPDVPLWDTGPGPQVSFIEEEIFDVSLGTFFVFDKERRLVYRFCRFAFGLSSGFGELQDFRVWLVGCPPKAQGTSSWKKCGISLVKVLRTSSRKSALAGAAAAITEMAAALVCQAIRAIAMLPSSRPSSW